MKQLYISPGYALLLSSLLFGIHPHMQAKDDVQRADVATEQNQAQESQVYICLDDSVSKIRQVITDMSQFDTDLDSPLHLLRRHIDNGNLLGLPDEIKGVLEYAHWFAGQNEQVLQHKELCSKFEDVANQFVRGELDITEEAIMQSPHLRLLTVDERMLVKEKAIFKNIVVMDKKLRVHGHARFYDTATFKKDVTIDGTLSVQDAVINGTLSVQDEVVGCDLTVGCNINMNNSTSSAVGNITKAGSSFIQNFGTNNTFVGVDAGNFTMTGTNNVGVGANVLSNNALGDSNTAIGSQALINNTDGIANVAVGVNTMVNNTTGNANVAVGASALIANTTGNANTAVGAAAMQSNTTGNANTGIGVTALQSNTTGNANTGLGASALQANTTGQNNTAAGANTLQSNTVGINNTAVGSSALAENVTGFQNTAVGSGALGAATSDTNTAVGFNALQNISGGGGSVAVGSLALHSNTTGFQNTAVGTTALGATTIGANNTAVGYHALLANISGIDNIAVGAGAAVSVTTGSNNIFVGTAIAGSTTTGSNNIYIDGSGLNPANESDTIRIGSSTTAAYVSGIYGAAVGATNSPVIIDNTGKLGTIVSSKRFKRNIEDMTVESDRIYGLKAVKFIYRKDATDTVQYGLIAEDVAQVFPELVIQDADGVPFTVRYEVLPVLLLNEFQKMADKMATMEDALVSIKKQLNQLKSR